MRARTPLIAAVLAVGLVQVVPVAAAPSDELWSAQWGPRQVDADLAWPTTTGSGATIAIVDCGLDLSHPDLRNVVGGHDAVDGGNGRGDWDPNNDGEGCDHGTHVAGIAGAAADNGGIVGVAPDADLLAVRVLDDEGSGSFEDIAAGVRWATQNGADVINMSLGALPGVQALGITGLLPELRDAIDEANAAGVVVVAASGNESFPLCGEPAFAEGVLCVTATDRFEAPSWYSNRALDPQLLAVAAPGGAGHVLCGEDIVSAVPLGTSPEYCGYGRDHTEMAGTSMAAPHVAGVAALVVSQGCDREQTLDIVTSTARAPLTESPQGVFDPVYGYGIVDADAAVAAASAICGGGGSDGGSTDGGTTDGGTTDGGTDGTINGAPTAADDSAKSDGRAVTIAVLSNDSDPDGDPLSVTGTSQPDGGTVTHDGTSVTYTPSDSFEGHDSFTYTISDGNGGTDSATVTVNVRRKGGGKGKRG